MGYFCHPERSEGFQLFEIERFFASLRMTIHMTIPSIGTFFNSLLVPALSFIIAKKGGRGRRNLPGILVLPSRFLTLVI